jgi:hypothetical protein
MGRPGDMITFLEIDPLVEEMAREHFDFLRRARARTEVQIGDGRLLLRRMPDRSMDVLIVDAFSSDAIPTHLLTREALALYLRKVRQGGIVLLHISNQHLDLTRVFRGWSSAEGRRVAVLGYRPTQGEAAQGAAPTLAIAIAPRQATLEAMIARGRWRWLGAGRSATWTDDRSNLLGAVGTIRF